jgi:3-dehydroquinate dehydratase-2
MKFIIINGPNLNLLGTREPEIYGNQGFEQYLTKLRDQFPMAQIDYYQSNIEGELINKLHEVGFSYTGIILNAGAYTHTSIAIGDAIKAINTPVVEVHLSNVFARESYRHESFLTPVCKGCISGFGLKSYELAVHSFF